MLIFLFLCQVGHSPLYSYIQALNGEGVGVLQFECKCLQSANMDLTREQVFPLYKETGLSIWLQLYSYRAAVEPQY